MCLISRIAQQLVSELVLEKEGVWSKPRNQSYQNMFLYIPSCRGRREQSTGETPAKHWCPVCQNAPTRAYVRTAHAHRRATRATRSFLAQPLTTELGWPATSSASQQPQQQLCTVISRVTRQVISHVINNSAWLIQVIKSGSSWLMFLAHHLRHVINLSLDLVRHRH